jgi:putative ABC transport system substrate-binding protein
MRRREVLAFLGGVAAGLPRVALAQQPGKRAVIGFLSTVSSSTWAPWTAGFIQRLGELGWTEGRTVAIEFRWADGRSERYAEIAAEFVRMNVDVIVTAGIGALATKQATSAIPIVFAIAQDPIGTGLVAGLSRPGGNVTGLSLQIPDLVGKRLELLREVIPGVRRLAILANIGDPAAVVERREVEAVGRKLGFDIARLEIRRAEDIAPAFAGLSGADALYVCGDSLANNNRASIYALALGARLPTISVGRSYLEAGSLMSYGPDYADLFRRAAEYVDKILRGAKVGDLPVEQPRKFELLFNLKTAKTLGIEIPSRLLFTADEVIE